MTFIALRLRLDKLDTGRLRNAGEVEYVIKRAKQVLLRKIKGQISQSAFSERAKRAFSKALKVEVKPSSLVITSMHPGFRYYVEGRKRRQMRWLLGTPSIPIITEEGKLIFRNATARSMKSAGGGPNAGKPGWIHPGRKPMDFIDRAKKEAREVLKEKLRAEIKKNLRAAVKRK